MGIRVMPLPAAEVANGASNGTPKDADEEVAEAVAAGRAAAGRHGPSSGPGRKR